ncbi:MAG: isoprenylcysteine carboxylmethyltransferase family protein [Anaerolineae bacterium]|nr:isoprenylcysteine carboxylmethyltransferase family protein [Anaerolineae bacterium]
MVDKKTLIRKLIFLFIFFIALYALLFFTSAGTFDYWQAWMYLLVLVVIQFAMTVYLLKTDPELLQRRLQFSERRKTQKRLISFSIPLFFLISTLPGLDQRFGWSNLSAAVSILAEVLVVVSYGIIALVFRENSYTSRIVEVAPGQKVIDTGPYALVRHPMYVGAMLMYLMMPLALGSWVAFLVSLLMIFFIVFRIRDEEKTLLEGLPGYREYTRKVKYRLIPGIW